MAVAFFASGLTLTLQRTSQRVSTTPTLKTTDYLDDIVPDDIADPLDFLFVVCLFMCLYVFLYMYFSALQHGADLRREFLVCFLADLSINSPIYIHWNTIRRRL